MLPFAKITVAQNAQIFVLACKDFATVVFAKGNIRVGARGLRSGNPLLCILSLKRQDIEGEGRIEP